MDASRSVAAARDARPARAAHRRWTGRGLLAALLCLLALGAAPAVSSATPLPPQGMYEACWPGYPIHNSCEARLQQMAAAGFKLVMNYSMLMDSTAQQVVAYANAAQADGLQVIWPLDDFWKQNPSGTNLPSDYPHLGATCGCSTNQGFVDYIVSLARGLPGTWGYYVADEPSASLHDQLKAFWSDVRAHDPNHPGLVVACGVCAGGDPTGSQAAPFNDLSVTLGTDLYPVFSQAPDPTYAYNYVAAGMQGLQTVDTSGGLQSAVALQAWNWSEGAIESKQCTPTSTSCRFPTEQEMEAERNAAVLNGHPSLILWFAMFDIIGCDPGQICSDWSEPTSQYQQRWNDLAQAAFSPNVSAPAQPPPSSSQPSLSSSQPPPSSSQTTPSETSATPIPVGTARPVAAPARRAPARPARRAGRTRCVRGTRKQRGRRHPRGHTAGRRHRAPIPCGRGRHQSRRARATKVTPRLADSDSSGVWWRREQLFVIPV